MANTVKRIRLNLEFHPDTYARMICLEKSTKASSVTEVMRKAIEVYAILSKEQSEGSRIQVKRKDAQVADVWII